MNQLKEIFSPFPFVVGIRGPDPTRWDFETNFSVATNMIDAFPGRADNTQQIWQILPPPINDGLQVGNHCLTSI
jgi:hypothetical protein